MKLSTNFKKDYFKILYAFITTILPLIYFLLLVIFYNNNILEILYTKEVCEIYYMIVFMMISALAYFFDITRKPFDLYLGFNILPLYILMYLSMASFISRLDLYIYLIIFFVVALIILLNQFLVKKKLLNQLLAKEKAYQRYSTIYYMGLLTLTLVASYFILF